MGPDEASASAWGVRQDKVLQLACPSDLFFATSLSDLVVSRFNGDKCCTWILENEELKSGAQSSNLPLYSFSILFFIMRMPDPKSVWCWIITVAVEPMNRTGTNCKYGAESSQKRFKSAVGSMVTEFRGQCDKNTWLASACVEEKRRE